MAEETGVDAEPEAEAGSPQAEQLPAGHRRQQPLGDMPEEPETGTLAALTYTSHSHSHSHTHSHSLSHGVQVRLFMYVTVFPYSLLLQGRKRLRKQGSSIASTLANTTGVSLYPCLPLSPLCALEISLPWHTSFY